MGKNSYPILSMGFISRIELNEVMDIREILYTTDNKLQQTLLRKSWDKIQAKAFYFKVGCCACYVHVDAFPVYMQI